MAKLEVPKKLIAKRKSVYIDRPIRKLYPLEGKAQIACNGQVSENVEEHSSNRCVLKSSSPK